MEPKVIRIEIKVSRTMATVLAGLLVALVLLAVPSAGAHPPLEGPGGQGGVTVASSVPTMISYQGQLLDSGGNPVPNGTYSMTFKLYNVPSGGTAFWEETHPSVQVTDGLFNVLLGGGGNPLDPSHFTGETYLGVTVDGDPEMTPRQQIVSVGYAFRAGIADQVAQGECCWECPDHPNPGRVYYLLGNVGIGTDDPQYELDVTSPTNAYIRANKNSKTAAGGFVLAADGENKWFMLMPTGSEDLWFWDPDADARLVIKKETGNVGIGTTDPQGLLQVGEGTFIVTSPENYVGINDLTPDAKLEVSVDGQAIPDLFMLSSDDNGDGDRFIVKNNGNVGIGTQTPSDKLHVFTTDAEEKITIETTDAYGVTSLHFRDYNSDAEIRWIGEEGSTDRLGFFLDFWGADIDQHEYLTILDIGNVGIGTASPTEKLDVNGRVRVRDLPLDSNLNDIVVADIQGVLHTRNASTLGGADADWYDVATGNPPTSILDDIYTHGNVGIGTAAPQTDLHVAASSDQSVRINGAGRITIHAPSGMTAAYLAAIDGINTWGMGKTLTTDNDFHIYNYPRSRTDLTILDSNGNVGIGTTDPSYKLHVSGDVHVTDRYLDSNEDPGSSGEILSSTAFGTDWISQSSLNDSDWSGAGSGSMYATNTGDNVGIGTTSPEDYKLRVNQDFISIDRGILLEASDGSEDLSIWVAGDAGIYTKSNKDLHFGTNNDYARNMTLRTDGNVGIGTTSPQSTLQIEGNPGYLQIDWITTSPNPTDCTPAHIGRMILQDPTHLWVCTSLGWKALVF